MINVQGSKRGVFCSFDRVRENITRENITEEITKGHIRRIDEIKLGYILYNVEGAKFTPGRGAQTKTSYYVVPTWCVSCIYVNSAKKTWSPSADPE